MASYYQDYSANTYKNEKHGYGSWYQSCTCCPYGYHIDLDFVQFCNTIVHQADRTGSIKRRKDRRRQRQSMEVLLGLEPQPVFRSSTEKLDKKTIDEEPFGKISNGRINIKQAILQDDLEEAVSTFERTLSKSKKLSNNLPDVTVVHESIQRVSSTSSMSSASGSSMAVLPPSVVTDGSNACKDFDTVSVESCSLSPLALQNIREQMALSLERTRELEEKVKLVPTLQTELSSLKNENERLLSRVRELEATNLNKINGNYLNNLDSSVSLQIHRKLNHTSVSDNLEDHIKPTVSRRDFGVMCGVLTRNVGVGDQCPNTRSVSTETFNDVAVDRYSDKWYNEKLRFLTENNKTPEPKKPISTTRGTQTPSASKTVHTSSQTVEKPKINVIKINSSSQTLVNQKSFCNVAVTASASLSSTGCQAKVFTETKGVSDDTTEDTFCAQCAENRKKENHIDQAPSMISLAQLNNVSRSKSFNLGSEKLNLTRTRKTVGCQYEPSNSHKACQYESKTQSKACQKEIRTIHKGCQHECSPVVSKLTDTKELIESLRKDASCDAKELTFDCQKCSKKEKEEAKKEENAMPSRIPRLQTPPTPVESRKFKRQDTYTKIPASSPPSNGLHGLSGLDLSGRHEDDLPSSFEKVKQNYKLSEVSSTSLQEVSSCTKATQPSESPALPIPEPDFCNPVAQSYRKKVKPSKEMLGAMKVLNDSLQKGHTENLKNQLKNAISIIQMEWFRISTLVDANPLDVEDYLDCFEDISCGLLRYIVNMVDASGNTAMHYAVSHGNFDVVSILLDSKVCDINQTNKAGYTSVMLVSLALCSAAHANVVRRLFQLADVNIRAKQHGQTALMLAVSHGRLDMVKMLLEAGADINIQDEDGSTALMCAAEHGHTEIVKHLLRLLDCDSTIVDVDGSTALKIAMEAGHRHIGVLLYAHERNLHGAVGPKLKRTKSASVSPKTPSSPLLPLRNSQRALNDSRSNK